MSIFIIQRYKKEIEKKEVQPVLNFQDACMLPEKKITMEPSGTTEILSHHISMICFIIST
jgi:hypothetical protein